MTGALVPAERSRLSELEAVVESGLQTFVEVGQALSEIRDSRLYRETHATFEDYCRERWQFTGRRGRQLIAAAEIGTIVPAENESQARALAPLLAAHGPTAVAEAWEAAWRESDSVTAAAISQAAAWTAWLIDWREQTGGAALTLDDVRRTLEEPLFELLALAPLDEAALAATHAALVLEDAGAVYLRTRKIPPPPPSFTSSSRKGKADERTRQAEWALCSQRRAGQLLYIIDVAEGAEPLSRLNMIWGAEVCAGFSNADLRQAARGHLYAAGLWAA